MARVKSGKITRARHKKVLAKTKGFRQSQRRLIKLAKTAAIRAGVFSYRDRKVKKRVFRSYWITQINAGLKPYNLKYSRFINACKKLGIELDRKALAYLAVKEPAEFKKVVEQVKATKSI